MAKKAEQSEKLIKETITDNLDLLLDVLPKRINVLLRKHSDLSNLREVVLDLGRYPLFRFTEKFESINGECVSEEDIKTVEEHVGVFNNDNRAGIERTLHRISAIRNRQGKIIGVTCRVGRAIIGTVDIINDIIADHKSMLVLGPPGVGKTTKLREIARILADNYKRRVIVVDTSNEIAGDGDIPHPGIGAARRMQVSQPQCQHAVMIEAVENHMPESIVVDEIGTEAEAQAARTIAERGVQLIGTAHGTSIKNILKNPTLSDLVGGIQAVILSDEEAKKRNTQKSILERKAPPTFEILIELHDRYTLAIYHDVAKAVDELLKGNLPKPEIRRQEPGKQIKIVQQASQDSITPKVELRKENYEKIDVSKKAIHIFPFSINHDRLARAIKMQGLAAVIVDDIRDADIVLTIKSQAKRNSKIHAMLRGKRIPLHVIKSDTTSNINRFLLAQFKIFMDEEEWVKLALRELEEVIKKANQEKHPVDAAPQSAYIRRLQHQYCEEQDIHAESIGDEPMRRIRVYPD